MKHEHRHQVLGLATLQSVGEYARGAGWPVAHEHAGPPTGRRPVSGLQITRERRASATAAEREWTWSF